MIKRRLVATRSQRRLRAMRVGRTVRLHALVLALLCGRACASVSVSTWPSLLSAVSSATSASPVSVTVTQPLLSTGTAAVVAQGASVTVSGACTPAPCTLDAATLSRHFVVDAGASLTLLAVNTASNALGPYGGGATFERNTFVNNKAGGWGGIFTASHGFKAEIPLAGSDANTIGAGNRGSYHLSGGSGLISAFSSDGGASVNGQGGVVVPSS